MLDNINLLYVAFTRAAERMHIVCTRSEKNPFLLAGDWVTGYLRAAFGDQPDGHYASGSKTGKTTPSHAPAMPVTTIGAYTFPAGATTVRLKQGSAISPAGDALARGLLLHELLSRVNVADDVGAALEAAVVSGDVPHDLKQDFRERLQAVVHHPRLADFFLPGTHSRLEAEIMTPEGQVLRPDKVVFMDTETVVIDYKTGAEKASDHAKQLQRYADALSRMGHTRVRKLLVYIDEARVVEVN